MRLLEDFLVKFRKSKISILVARDVVFNLASE